MSWMHMRHFLRLACVGATTLVLLTGCGDKGPQKPVAKPLAVQTVSVTSADHPQWITLLGQAEGGKEVDVKAQVSGLLKEIRFTEGNPVKAGDILYVIDPAPFEAKLHVARANTRSARAEAGQAFKTFERTKALLQTGAKSQQDYDADKRALEVARAKVSATEAAERDAGISLEWTNVRASADGLVGRTQLNPGALISAQSTVLTRITQHDDVRVRFAPSSRSLDGADITLDNAVKLLDERGRTIPAVLDYVAQSINPQTSTRLMRARIIDNPGLIPGDFVRVHLQTGTRRDAVLVPQKAITQLPDGTYSVYLFKDGKAKRQAIKVDRWSGPNWIAIDGLKTGDRVIVNQLLKLRDGLQVRLAGDDK